MKRFYCLLSLLGALLFVSPSHARNYLVESADSTLDVFIYNEVSSIGKPKAPASIPIAATYRRSINSIQLSFLYNLGVMDVDVMNTSSGYTETISIETSYLSAIIPLSFGTGHYIVYFYIPSNKKYFCELEV